MRNKKIKTHRTTLLLLVMAGLLFAACSKQAATTTAIDESKMKDPKSSIAYQLELLKAGDVEKLKSCLTSPARESVTKEGVDKAKANSANYTIEDLYDSAEMGEMDGKKTAKVKMKNGRTLTMLIETDGKWMSNSMWFK